MALTRTIQTASLFAALVAASLAVACGRAGQGESEVFEEAGFAGSAVPAPAVPAPSREAPEGPAAMPAATPAPAPTAAPAALAAPQAPRLPKLGGEAHDETSFTEEDVALVAQQRIIVRTVDLGLVVADVAASLDSISGLAQELGGWVVSSDRSQKHRGSISIRVPATELDDVIVRLRALAVEVESEVSTSQDVTDEYVDATARLTNLQATEEALLKLLERAASVEDALNVQNRLTQVQGDVESFQGRIKFLEQTAAFSLVNVNLRLAPTDMPVDAGADQTFSVGQPARFRASFKPPEDIEQFSVTWDFGDGSPEISLSRTAPTLDKSTRVTATVAHVYTDDRDSPFIAEVKIIGTGDAGVAEGTDTVNVTVTRLPVVEVFAGEGRVTEEDQEVELVGSFTRPEGLTELTFRWDFGDGSASAGGSLEEGATTAGVVHVYADHRPFPYTATLTITGQSEAGEVEASNSIGVLVTESKGWVLSGWSAGDNWKTATRALSGVGQGLATFLIWLGIFSPVWIVGGAVAFLVRRRIRRSRSIDRVDDL